MNPAVSIDEMHGMLEVFSRQLRITPGDPVVLERQILHSLAGGLLPTLDPERAKPAIAIVEEDRFARCDSLRIVHGLLYRVTPLNINPPGVDDEAK